MITIAAISLGAMILGGLAKGTANYFNKEAEYKAQKAEYKRQYEIATRKLSELEVSYNLQQEDLSESLKQTKIEANQGIYTTGIAQAQNARSSAYINVENQSLMYNELADIQREGIQAVGSAVSSAAGSGFRNSEGSSVANVIEETETSAGRRYETSRRQIQLSSYQSYMQAANDYFSANVQLENYRQAIANAENTFDIKSRQLTADYTSQKNDLTDTQSYYKSMYENTNWDAWKGFLAFVGGI